MIILAAFALVAQVTPPRQTVVRDSTKPDSAAQPRRRGVPAPVRRPVTVELQASAFRDAPSRDLIAKARAARVSQDAAITSYDAKVAQRLSVKAAVGSVTLERLAYRQENAARVQWQLGVGAHVDVTGARVSIPMLGMPKVERDAVQSMSTDPGLVPLPYFPGQEPLWVGQFAARRDVNENSMVNPLANGAEAYYTYRSGDLTKITLASGDSIAVRQIDVRPRTAGPNLFVGSVWLDDATGQVVRAAYRMAAPGRATVSVSNPDSVTGKNATGAKFAGAILKSVVPTMVAEVTDIVVEYQRVRGFWLPRSQVMEGFVKSSFAKVPVTLENSFRFESVNETTGLDAFTVDTMSWRQRKVDSVNVGPYDQCKNSPIRVVTAFKADSVPVQIRVTCNTDSLLHSSDLPASAFDEGEEIFGTAQREALVAQALSLADQAPFSWNPFRKPDLQYGVSFTRYNRIEGFSTGLLATQQMGAGFEISALGRVSTADRPRGEFSLARSNASQVMRLTGYDRLVPMSDWETPLTFGSSLSAFFFGRDDAFYFRTRGAELTWNTERGIKLDWRVFREDAHTAIPKAEFSVGGSFGPNLPAEEGWFTGIGLRLRSSHGLNPRGLRVSTDIRIDGTTRDEVVLSPMSLNGFARGAAEMTVTQGLGRTSDVTLTLAGGSSIGEVPVQRLWYIGGTQTVRGQDPSPMLSGNAFWLTRGEIGRPIAFLRLSLFGDLGWAGDRTNFSEVGRPASGAGVGFSLFDGAARFDVARGIYPMKQTRVSFYLGSRF